MPARTDATTWIEYFGLMAIMAASRSKDPNTQNGAVIVNEKHRVVSVGYNGFPNGCDDNVFPWESPEKYPFIICAERNGIYNTDLPVRGCTMFLFSQKGYYPCCNCAQAIIQKGIKKVSALFIADKLPDKWSPEPTLRMFDSASVEVEDLSQEFKGIVSRGQRYLEDALNCFRLAKGEL